MQHVMNILMIEDSSAEAQLIEEYLHGLSEFRYQLEHRASLTEGLEAIASSQVDAILLDLGLPESSGIETLRKVRQAAGLLPIVVLTSHGDDALALAAVQEGAHDFLVKGETDADRLARSLRYSIERTRGEMALRESEVKLLKLSQERRNLVARLVKAQEDERKRMANDIHDDSIQVMTAVGMRLETLRRHLPNANFTPFNELQEVVRSSIERLRHLIFELVPPSLEDRGLGAALRDQIDGWSWSEREIDVEIRDVFGGEPSIESRTILYRIAQEALANVRKHSGASKVLIELTEDSGGYRLRVVDNGCGFSSTGNSIGHVGLTCMRERAEIAGGGFSLRSAEGDGTTIEAWLPRDMQGLVR